MTERPASWLFERLPLLVAAILLAPLCLHAVAALAPGVGSYVVASDSMGESVPVGSLVVVQQTEDYAVGDVITFVQDGRRITHRIVAVRADGFVTSGDATDQPDAWVVSPGAVLGERLLVLPWYGRLLGFAGSPGGLAAFVYVPGIVLLLSEVRRLRGLL
ncbi:signal peptidase I [Haloarchaeobius sp. TZWWS8]|uniref:signal peptidase I n=1 Tax=Haloarchaeobius sp. TZWWS8 TaxID=3446121 RepID=UPI003EB6DC0C